MSCRALADVLPSSGARPDQAIAVLAWVSFRFRRTRQWRKVGKGLTEPAAGQRRRRTCRGTDVRCPAAEDVTRYLREQQITLTYDPAAENLHTAPGDTATTITMKAS